MNAAAFWSEVVECRRLLRLHRQIKDEIWELSSVPALRRMARWHRFARWFLPWVAVPLLGLASWDWLGLSYSFGLGLVIFATVVSILLNSPLLQMTSFLVLRMPSRRALYLARLMRWLPFWLWGGLWGTAGLLLANWGAIRNGTEAALLLLIGAQVPLLCLGLLTVLGVALRFLGGWTFPLFILFLSAGVWLQPIPALAPYRPLIPFGMLLLEIGLLALYIWNVGRVEPMSQILAVQDPARAAQQAQPSASPFTVLYRGRVPAQLGPASWMVGRQGLGWAAAYYAVAKLLGGGYRAIAIRCAALALFVFMFVAVAGGETDMWPWFLLGATSLNPFNGSLLRVGHPQRLYLLGVDYRCQLIHRLRTFWVTPVLLVASVGVLAAAIVWGQVELPLALLGLVAGLTLAWEGLFGWPIVFFGSKMGCWSLLLLQEILALWVGFLVGVDRWAWLPGLGWSTATRVLLFAAPCAAIGLAGILYKWWRLDEARLAAVQHSQSGVS